MYRFIGSIGRYNEYGERIVARTPATILADTLEEAQVKARTMIGAEYDSFRKFWSHGFSAERVVEVPPWLSAPRQAPPESRSEGDETI